MGKKKVIWAIVSLVIAGFSIWAVTAQSTQFTLVDFERFVIEANKGWLFAALICMFGFIWFEGMAIKRIAGVLGYKRSQHRGTVYSAADVYFSAITPSASGGQPASAFFMMRDGIPGTVTTVTLLVNLVMYNLALLIMGIFCVVLRFDLLKHLSVASHVLIIAGSIVLSALALVFYLLLRRETVLYFISDKLLHFLDKIHLLKHGQRKREKMQATMADFRECKREMNGKKAIILEALFWNVMQRVSQFGVAFFVFLACGESFQRARDVFATQCFVSLGSNCAPIPGAMGVADYLMLDGYGNIVGDDLATNMELLCRGMSFYGCILTSAVIVLVAFIIQKIRRDKKC